MNAFLLDGEEDTPGEEILSEDELIHLFLAIRWAEDEDGNVIFDINILGDYAKDLLVSLPEILEVVIGQDMRSTDNEETIRPYIHKVKTIILELQLLEDKIKVGDTEFKVVKWKDDRYELAKKVFGDCVMAMESKGKNLKYYDKINKIIKLNIEIDKFIERLGFTSLMKITSALYLSNKINSKYFNFMDYGINKQIFSRLLDKISQLTGYRKGYLIDRAINVYLDEYIFGYCIIPWWDGSYPGIAAIIRYVCQKRGWNRKQFRNEVFKWWLNGFRYLNRDLKHGFSFQKIGEENFIKQNYKVDNDSGVEIWFDHTLASRGLLPNQFQLVSIGGKLCRVPVGAFCEI